MGILDAILGGVLGGNAGGPMSGQLGNAPGGTLGGAGTQAQNPLLLMALQLLQQNGGIQGILAKLQQAGYGQQAQSWIGTGANLPIDSRAVQQVFGQGQLGQIAQQLGISPDQASDGVSQMLPQVVDQMTPAGQIPENHGDLVNEALAILQRGRGG
jgi:uncharacterized protein YidB (DUF937 family)